MISEEEAKRIRANYKKKYGRELPKSKPIIERWKEEPIFIKTNELSENKHKKQEKDAKK